MIAMHIMLSPAMLIGSIVSKILVKQPSRSVTISKIKRMIALSSNKIINIEILRALAIISVILNHIFMGQFYDLDLMSNDFFCMCN